MSDTLREFQITAHVEGRAFCTVKATTEEEAIEKAKNEGKWELEDWDISTASYRGGYIHAEDGGPA